MNREDRVTEVLAAYRERIERGEDVDPESSVREHPDLADELRRRFDAERRVQRMLHGNDVPPEPSTLTGHVLGPYRLGTILGTGGMGTVYRATVETRAVGMSVGDTVAVKVVHPHLLHRGGYFKRFLREAEMGRRLRHANVVRTLDADAVRGDGGHFHFLVMEFVEGQTLRALLDEVGKVPEELCRHVGREVAKALAAIHAEGVVHRDVKPDNVIIAKDHTVKLMDLGVARLDDDELRVSQTGAFVGSVRYAAPEQFRGRSATVDGRADLYALGLTLYELVTGRHPFEGEVFHDVLTRQLTETPRPAGELNPQISPFLEELLRSLLAKDPAQRLASAADLGAALEDGDRSAWWHARALEVRAETHRPLRRIRIPRETALYGRDTELATLRALFDRAKAGDGKVVLVEGEAGIGKSRLVDEFVGALRCDGDDVDFLFGSYPPGGAATASGAFSTAYREHFVEADLESALREALPQTPLLVPAFAALLRGDATPAGAELLTKDSLQTVFVHATRSVAALRPAIVLIDDLHFATDDGRALFMSLALAVPGHRILLVGTTRPGISESWTTGLDRLGHASRLPLPRLGPKDLTRLLVDAFRSERLAEELGFRIAAKSDGNPYFVFEILRGLREGQLLTQRPDGTWVTTQILQDIQIPSTIRDLVAARVADLAPEDKDLLDVASCLGFEFDAGVVAEALGEAHVPVLRRLARIEAKHRLVRSAGERFVFDHHQVQETLYGALPPPLAREYHAAIGSAIEMRSGAASRDAKDVEGAACVNLAEHFLKGGQGAKALRYLDPALTHLERGALHDAAIALAGRALGLQALVVGRHRCEILLRVAKHLGFLGRSSAELPVLDESVALADASGDGGLRIQARIEHGRHLWQVGRYPDAEAELSSVLELALLAGDRKQWARATGIRGLVLQQLGRLDEARSCHDLDLAFAEETGDRRREALVLGNIGLVLSTLGRHAEALASHERHLAIAQELSDLRSEARASGNLGVQMWELGRFVESGRFYERHLELAREIGDRYGEARTLGNLGLLSFSLGRYDDARDRHSRSLALAREIGSRLSETYGEANLAVVLLAVGRSGEAQFHFKGAVSRGMEIGARIPTAWALHGLANVAAEEGDVAEADRRFADALGIRRAMGSRDGEAETLRAQGALLARNGLIDEARSALENSLAIARELSLPSLELLATVGLAALPGGNTASALAVSTTHEGRADFREVAEARFLLWQATHDPAHLAEAKRRLDFLVEHAPPDCRESMLTNVRLHREIAAAAAQHGV